MSAKDGPTRAGPSKSFLVALGLVAVLSPPLFAVTVLASIVGLVWLTISGEWAVLFGGFVWAVIGPVVISVALFPRIALLAVVDRTGSASLLARLALILSLVYTAGVITAWCLWVLGNLMGHASPPNHVPTLLWAYSAAVSPLVFLALRDSVVHGAPAPASLTTLFAQLGFIIVALFLLFGEIGLLEAAGVLGGTILVGQAVNWIVMRESSEEGVAESDTASAAAAAVSSEVIQCGQCGQRMRVPLDRGQTKVSCPSCNDGFLYVPPMGE